MHAAELFSVPDEGTHGRIRVHPLKQVQILGLRDMSEELNLRKPSIATYVQTTDRYVRNG